MREHKRKKQELITYRTRTRINRSMVTIDLIRVNANALYTVKPAPYAELSYMLTTDYGVNYTISFMPSDLMPEYDAYEFAISNTNNRKYEQPQVSA